ncbi:MAG: EAL domain-containing protein [Spirochaetales bacterium]|nr:EAL domain-containing protein [Spirochaetales bacterium]
MILGRTVLRSSILGALLLSYAAVSYLGLDLYGNILSPLLSFACAWYALRAALSMPDNRFPWYSVASGAGIWGIADLVWAVQEAAGPGNPDENVFLMYLYLLPGVAYLLAFLYIAFYDRRRWASFQFLIDLAAIFSVLIGSVYSVFFHEQFLSMFSFDHEVLSASLYLIVDLFLITFGVSVYLTLRKDRIPFHIKIIFTAIFTYALIDFVYVYEIFHDMYVPNSLIDVVYMVSIALLGFASVLFIDFPTAVAIGPSRDKGIAARINRALLLLAIPLIASFIRPPTSREVVFFASVILLHQAASLIIHRLVRRELELEEKDIETRRLDALVQERTRELQIMNQTLENLVHKDAITGQYNRKFFMDEVERWLAEAQASEKIWMILLDFNRFKTINDTYGHDVGDLILRQFGKRFETLSEDRILFARLGGDEFGVVCRKPAADPILPLVQQLMGLCSAPVQVGNFTLHIGVSIGVAVFPDDAHTRGDLMRHADIAMYIAKGSGVSGVSFFDHTANEGVERQHQIDIALKKAPIPGEFSLVYQPQYTARSKQLIGMEALLRWNSSELGFVPPDAFISIAEENGVIIPLSEWVMKESIRQITEWNRRYGLSLAMGINISPLQLDDPRFVSKLDALLAEAGAEPKWINLEVTERSAMKGEKVLADLFKELSRRNISLSIDDFGTGYSSLSYLKRFEIDYLKIAKPLVDGLADNETDRQIVQAIVMIATALGLRTIAEGVEDESQLAILDHLGCDEIQGYFFGKPVNPQEFERLHLKRE